MGGICVDMSNINKILEIHGSYLSSELFKITNTRLSQSTRPYHFECWIVLRGLLYLRETRGISHGIEQDSDIVCQSGVGWMEINETLQKKGRDTYCFGSGSEINVCL